MQVLYILDIFIQLRIARINKNTGEELKYQKDIARDYLFSFSFLLDATAAIPCTLFVKRHMLVLEVLPLFKLLNI